MVRLARVSLVGSSVRPKALSLRHDTSVATPCPPSRASALESEAPDSCHKIATALLRRSRNVLALTQERAAALVDTHPISLGRRERGQVDLGPLRDWVLLLREMVRARGPEATAAFLAEFVEILAASDGSPK